MYGCKTLVIQLLCVQWALISGITVHMHLVITTYESGSPHGLRQGRASPSPDRWCTSHSTWCNHRTERRTQRGTPCWSPYLAGSPLGSPLESLQVNEWVGGGSSFFSSWGTGFNSKLSVYRRQQLLPLPRPLHARQKMHPRHIETPPLRNLLRPHVGSRAGLYWYCNNRS